MFTVIFFKSANTKLYRDKINYPWSRHPDDALFSLR